MRTPRFLFLLLVILFQAAVLLDAQNLRTPWGEPDLQGIWSNPYVTPLERPKEFGTREFLTKEEIAAAERKLLE